MGELRELSESRMELNGQSNMQHSTMLPGGLHFNLSSSYLVAITFYAIAFPWIIIIIVVLCFSVADLRYFKALAVEDEEEGQKKKPKAAAKAKAKPKAAVKAVAKPKAEAKATADPQGKSKSTSLIQMDYFRMEDDGVYSKLLSKWTKESRKDVASTSFWLTVDIGDTSRRPLDHLDAALMAGGLLDVLEGMWDPEIRGSL